MDEHTSGEKSTVTYVAGLGFVPNDDRKQYLRDIRITSNITSFFVLLAAIAPTAAATPMLYFLSIFFDKISINYTTGLIISNPLFLQIAAYSSKIMSVSFCMLALLFIFRKRIKTASKQSAENASFRVASSISMSVAFLGLSAAAAFFVVFGKLLGVAFEMPIPLTLSFNSGGFVYIGYFLLYSALHEILFRSVVLNSFRKFGDGFAVIISAVFGALFGCNLFEFIFMMFWGITAGYFAVHYNKSIYAVITRIMLSLFIVAMQIGSVYIESSLFWSIVVVVFIVVIAFAAVSFIRFLQTDSHAFIFEDEDEIMPTGNKLAAATSSMMFLILMFTALLTVAFSLQTIRR